MVSRISTFANNQAMVNRMLQTQVKVFEAQTQIGTEKKSQTYTGIAPDSFRLISIEGERSRLDQYIKNNSIAETNAKAMVTTIESADEVLRLLRSELISFTSRDLSSASNEDVAAVTDIQERAFSALNDMEFFLNLKIDGKYLFGGGQTDSPPVSIPYDNVTQFQEDYNGIERTYAETRTAHLSQAKFEDVTVTYTNENIPVQGEDTDVTRITGAAAGDLITATLDSNTFGDLTFSNVDGAGVITSSNQDAFNNVTVGQTILINGTESAGAGATDNNGVYTVTAVSGDGTQITLDQVVANAGTELAAVGVNINLAVPNGTTMFLSGDDVTNDGAYTVRWPTNAEIAGIPLDVNAAAPAVVTGDVMWVTGQVLDTSGEDITLDAAPYYRGDRLETEHRVSENRVIKFGVNGLDPAFEKAIRAIGQVLQGDLINNQARAVDALELLNNAIEHSPQSTEMPSDMQDVAQRLAINQKIIFDAKETMKEFDGFLGQRQIELENVDVTEAAVRLQDDVRALEISFATLARIQNLSLNNFL